MKAAKFFVILAIGIGASISSAANVTESFTKTYPFSESGTLRLENISGAIEITAWDKNEISVEAVKSAAGTEDLARIHLVIEATPDRVTIKTSYDKNFWLFGSLHGEVRYTLHAPAHTRLEEISVIKSAIRVRDMKGPLTLKTVNGSIEATGLAARGHFETVNGPINVEYVTLEGIDALSFHTINGRCDLTLPKGAPYSVDSKTVNGGVRTDEPIKIDSANLGHFRGGTGEGGPKISFGSVNGELSIHTR